MAEQDQDYDSLLDGNKNTPVDGEIATGFKIADEV
jgi:hypothetical protein